MASYLAKYNPMSSPGMDHSMNLLYALAPSSLISSVWIFSIYEYTRYMMAIITNSCIPHILVTSILAKPEKKKKHASNIFLMHGDKNGRFDALNYLVPQTI